MKTTLLKITFFILLLPLALSAQIEGLDYVIKTKADSSIRTIELSDTLYNYVIQKPNFMLMDNNSYVIPLKMIEKRARFRKPCFVADGFEYNMENIRFYQQNEVMYASMKEEFGKSTFAKCEKRGEINLYSLKRTSYSFETGRSSLGALGGIGYSNLRTYYFINRKFEPIKRATYENIYEYVKTDPDAVKHLEKYKKQRRLGFGLAIGGLALVAAGGITTIAYPTSTTELGVVLAGTGALTILASNIVYFTIPSLIKTIDIYNNGYRKRKKI